MDAGMLLFESGGWWSHIRPWPGRASPPHYLHSFTSHTSWIWGATGLRAAHDWIEQQQTMRLTINRAAGVRRRNPL